MSDPVVSLYEHEKAIRTEELREFVSTGQHYVNTPHLLVPHVDGAAPFDWDTARATSVGARPLPSSAPPLWTLPAGVWTVRLHLRGELAPLPFVPWRGRVRVRLLADTDPGATLPEHEFIQDLTTTCAGQVGALTGQIRGQIESAPLVSAGTLQVWAEALPLFGGGVVSLGAATRIVFGQLA